MVANKLKQSVLNYNLKIHKEIYLNYINVNIQKPNLLYLK